VKSLTDVQRRALHLAARKGGNELGNAKGQIRRQTANLLALKEWVTIVNGVALITKAGRAELLKPIPEDPDVWLRQLDGLTTSLEYAVLSEGPVLDTSTLKGFWKERALRNSAATQDGRQHARQLKRATRNWPTSGPVGPVTTRFDPDVVRDEAA
jgi:hypothetical protein